MLTKARKGGSSSLFALLIESVSIGISESLHILANEPSLGLYRLQEHVHRSVPEIVEKKVQNECG